MKAKPISASLLDDSLRPIMADEIDAYHKGWPSPMKTDADMGQGWMAMRVEMYRGRLAKRLKLEPRDLQLVVNRRTGCGYFQWVGVARYIPTLPPSS